MYKEFTVWLIDTKSNLQQRLHENGENYKAIKGELLLKSLEEQEPIKKRLEENRSVKAAIEEKIIRAERYGKHHLGEGKTLVCPACYIEKDEISELEDIKPVPINFMKNFFCERCSFEMLVQRPIGEP